jgi:hypothetical protein
MTSPRPKHVFNPETLAVAQLLGPCSGLAVQLIHPPLEGPQVGLGRTRVVPRLPLQCACNSVAWTAPAFPQAEVPEQGGTAEQGQGYAHPHSCVDQGDRSWRHRESTARSKGRKGHPLGALPTCPRNLALPRLISSHHTNDISAPRL